MVETWYTSAARPGKSDGGKKDERKHAPNQQANHEQLLDGGDGGLPQTRQRVNRQHIIRCAAASAARPTGSMTRNVRPVRPG